MPAHRARPVGTDNEGLRSSAADDLPQHRWQITELDRIGDIEVGRDTDRIGEPFLQLCRFTLLEFVHERLGIVRAASHPIARLDQGSCVDLLGSDNMDHDQVRVDAVCSRDRVPCGIRGCFCQVGCDSDPH